MTRTNILHLDFNVGDLILILAVVLWAIYSTASRFLPDDFDSLLLLFVASIFAELFLVPATLLEHHFGHVMIVDQSSIGVLIYLAVFPAIVGYVSWNIGLKKIGNSTCGILSYLITLFSSILAVFFLKENLYTFHFIGFALILAGSYFTIVNKNKAVEEIYIEKDKILKMDGET